MVVGALAACSGAATNVRYPSLCFGLCFCFLTIKLVVLGMARMAYASIQWADLLPLMIVTALSHADTGMARWINDHFVYELLALGYLARLVLWTQSAVGPLCRRMKIRLFRIPSSKKSC
jgi:hypothetical protein